MHLSAAGYALAGTIAGALIGFLATVLSGWLQRRAERATRLRQAIENTLAAADDLLDAVNLYRSSGGSLIPFMSLGAGMAAFMNGIEMTRLSPEDRAVLTLRQRALLKALDLGGTIMPGGAASNVLDKTATRYIGTVAPARQRLTQAVAPLRICRSRSLAQAAEGLTVAAGKFADNASSLPLAHRHAMRNFERAVRRFRSAAAMRRRKLPPFHYR